MLHFCRIFQRGVHVPVTMSVRDPLHGLGGCFTESDRCSDSLHQKELLLLPEPLALFLCLPAFFFLVLLFFARFWSFCSISQKQKPVSAEGMLAAMTIAVTSMCSPPEKIRFPCV